MATQEKTRKFLPYGRQHITEEDIEAVAEVLRSDWLTQGPVIDCFEEALAQRLGAAHVAACATGTAALHLSMLALGIGPGDMVVTSPNTFLADANCARFVGADVAFADINPDTGIMAPEALARVLETDSDHRIKAVIPVHFAGQPADLPKIHELAEAHGSVVIDDGCHALGASYEHEGAKHNVGDSAHSVMTAFSFHPVKHVAMGEGGAVTTADGELAEKLRTFRNHGMTKTGLELDDMARSPKGDVNPWYYEMQQLGYNYRVTDVQCALGLSQLKRLDWSVRRRNEIARLYARLIEEHFEAGTVAPLQTRPGVTHAYHLFVVKVDFERFGVSRAEVMTRLREVQIGTQVHYIPVPLQPYYRRLYGTKPGDFPNAEAYYERALSLPMYPDLSESDCIRVIEELALILTSGSRWT
jgi:UDP-4-amino-4,6-dideoxy-N-acetyl-beta-L-altrosamine transaminase